jgi:hypothetical protein
VVRFFAAIAVLFSLVPLISRVVHAELASKVYVDRIVTGIVLSGQPDWTQTDPMQTDYIQNKPALGALAGKDAVSGADIDDGAITNADISDSAAIAKSKLAADAQASLGRADTAVQPAALAQVAFSGSWNDLSDKPAGGSGYMVQAGSIQSAAPGGVAQVSMDGLVFKTIKQTVANYWGVRIQNSSGQSLSLGFTWSHLYGAYQGRNSSVSSMSNGAEYNPDVEDGDVGYGGADTAMVYVFDKSRMHLYRWNTMVSGSDAVVVVERLI